MPEKPSIVQLIISVLSTFAAAIQTHRADTDEIARLKAQSAEEHEALIKALADLETEKQNQADVDGLRDELEAALELAAAAKPPTDEHIEEVKAIGSASDPGSPVGGTGEPVKPDSEALG